MVVMVMLQLGSTGHTATTTARIRQRSPLAKLATRLVAAQIIHPGEAALAAQTVELAERVLVLGPVRRHVPLEIRPLAVQVLAADVAVHLVAVVARRHVLVAHLLVHERLGAARERAFERALGVRHRGRGRGRDGAVVVGGAVDFGARG